MVIIQPAEIETIFAETGSATIELLELQYQLNGVSGSEVVLNQQNAHANSLPRQFRYYKIASLLVKSVVNA